MTDGSSAERRRHDRAQVDGCVLVHVPGGAVHCRVVNLSLGGILVRAIDAGPGVEAGMPVMVELELEHLGWATQAGEVVRARGTEVAISFAQVAPALADAIVREVCAAHDAETNPRVVVLDPSPGRRRRITEALEQAGARSYEVATPLEAVDLIERSRVRVQGVAIARRTRSQTDSDELVDYLSESHPDLRVAVIEDDDENPRSGLVRELLARDTSST